jgi:hypothetical protein
MDEKWKPQPFCGFPQAQPASVLRPAVGRLFLIFDLLVSAVEQRVWNGKNLRLHHICKTAFCARGNVN